MKKSQFVFPKIKFSFKMASLVAGVLAVSLLATVLYAYVRVSKDVPEIKKVADYKPLGVTQILSVENDQTTVMAEFYKERRYLTPYDQIPDKLIKAFLSAEDSSFFEHEGINLMAIGRAAMANFMAGHVVQGGSTITQQIAKSLYLSPEKNIVRKIKETFLAMELEKNLKKEEILYLYLNQIYLGSGSYGVQAAARQYFQKDLKKLNVAEMALIAGLPTAPGKYSPLLNPKKAKERQLYVLRRMKENGFISEAEREKAAAQSLRIFVNDGTTKQYAPHLVEHIRRYLITKFGEKALYEDGLTVLVPAAIRFFKQAQDALESGLEEIDQKRGYRGPIRNVAKAEWEKTQDELKAKVAKEFFPFRILTEDGRLDLEEAIRETDPKLDKTLSGKKVEVLITQVDTQKQIAFGSAGLFLVQLPFEGMKWASKVKDGVRKEPKTVSDVLSPGDVVWVKSLNYQLGVFKGLLTQPPEIEGAVYSVDIQTGQILAMNGGYDFERSEFNRATQAKRQMGSTFKPIIYAAAVERGYTPATIIVDAPIVFDDPETGRWKPENYEEKFYGDTTFRQALIASRNIPTVKIVQDIKVSSVINLSQRLGIQGPFNHDLSISLGSAVSTVQDLVHAFTAFPMLGKPFHAMLFEKILDRDGRVLETSQDLKKVVSEQTNGDEAQTKEQAPFAPQIPGLRLDPRVAYVMTHLMKEVVMYGTAAKANSLGRALAGKTGTTQDFRDGWFVGFSPRVVTGVWVGFDDQRTMNSGETGANTALPIWMRYMSQALRSFPEDEFEMPDGITFTNIDAKTGKPNANGIKEAFISGTEPNAQLNAKKEAEKDTGETLPPQSPTDFEDEFLKEDE